MRASVWGWLIVAVCCGAAGCVTTPVSAPKPVSAWEPVAVGVTLVAEDPGEDALLVRAGGRVTAIVPPLAPGQKPQRPPTPALDVAPALAQATITAARTLRASTPRGWVDETGALVGAPWAVPLPAWSVRSGVLVEVPLLGPDQGRPRPRCLLEGAPWGDDTLAAGREDHVVLASEGRAASVVTASCEVLPIGIEGHRPLAVRPGVSPDGRVVAVAVERLEAAEGAAPYGIAVVDHGRVARVVPISKAPIGLHVAAGAVFVLVEESQGVTLLRHGFGPTRRFVTDRDRAVITAGEGLRLRLAEALDAGDVAVAADVLELLRSIGHARRGDPEIAGASERIGLLAQPLLTRRARAAMAEGSVEFAAALERRAMLVGGGRVLEAPALLPTLQIALAFAPETGLTEAALDRLLAPGHVRRVNACAPPGERGRNLSCLSLAFVDAPSAPDPRPAAARYLERRLNCLDEGDVRADLDGAPIATWSCDLEASTLEPLAAFRAALGAAAAPLATRVTYDDGTTETLVVAPVAGLTPVEAALDAALERQAAKEARNARRSEAETRTLRTVLWRHGAGADEAIRQAIRADGLLREGWP